MSGESSRDAGAKTKANVIVGAIVAAVVVVAVVAMAVMRFGVADPGNSDDMGGLRALVHDGDGITHEIPLSVDSETTIETGLGTNVVQVRDGSVFVSEADCDNHDCIRQGGIDAPGRQIICLPHKLWIEVVAGDGVSGQMNVGSVAGGGGEGEGLDVVAR